METGEALVISPVPAADAPTTVNQEDVAAMLEKLGITEDDRDDVVFEEDKQSEEVTRWMAIMKVHTDTGFSHFWFFKNMNSCSRFFLIFSFI
jgi:hypothetical protein